MQTAGTELGSLAAEARAPQAAVLDGGDEASNAAEPQMNGGDPGGSAQLEQAPTVQVALAVCGEVAGGDLAVASVAQPVPAVVSGAHTFEDEFRDFDLTVSVLVRLAIKRAVDVLVAGLALFFLLPLFLVIALAIKLTDGGPIFFVQRRVGWRAETFRMLKFRSMVVHAERLRPRLEIRNESSGPVFKMKLDPRVTPVGRFIRKYSLDELPQLINVLMGDMSLVGPRPSLPREVASYQPWQYRRFAVRPGLTCFWQVCRGRYQISFDDWMRLDLKYVDEWSLRLDLEMILRTFGIVLGGTGE
jgi:lipopolysaccharide/colanic/teichoic acid biosynthesis glycosyltransferase